MGCAAEYVAKQAEKEEQRAAALAAKAAAKEARRREISQVGSWLQAHRLVNCAVAADMVVYRVHTAYNMQTRLHSIAFRGGCVDHQYSHRQVKQATAIPGQAARIHFMHEI